MIRRKQPRHPRGHRHEMGVAQEGVMPRHVLHRFEADIRSCPVRAHQDGRIPGQRHRGANPAVCLRGFIAGTARQPEPVELLHALAMPRAPEHRHLVPVPGQRHVHRVAVHGAMRQQHHLAFGHALRLVDRRRVAIVEPGKAFRVDLHRRIPAIHQHFETAFQQRDHRAKARTRQLQCLMRARQQDAVPRRDLDVLHLAQSLGFTTAGPARRARDLENPRAVLIQQPALHGLLPDGGIQRRHIAIGIGQRDPSRG